MRDLHDQGYGWRRIARKLSLPPRWVQDVCSYILRPYVPLKWPPQGGDNGPAERMR